MVRRWSVFRKGKGRGGKGEGREERKGEKRLFLVSSHKRLVITVYCSCKGDGEKINLKTQPARIIPP